MAWIVAAAVAAVASAAISTYSAVSSSQAQAAQARNQAKGLRDQAKYAQDAAAAEAENKRRQYDRILGAQRARYGATGVIASEGTPLLVMMESEEEAALDIARVRHGGAVAAHGLREEARQLRRSAAQTQREGYLTGTATMLQGVSSAMGSYGKASAPSRPTTAQSLYAYP